MYWALAFIALVVWIIISFFVVKVMRANREENHTKTLLAEFVWFTFLPVSYLTNIGLRILKHILS